MKRKIALAITVVVMLVCVTLFFVWKKKQDSASRHAEPQQSVEEILQERALQAKAHLDTPLGRSFEAKNWTEFEKLYQPQKNFHDLAEIIRANFIGNEFKGFTQTNMDHVLGLVLKTFDEMKPQDFALAGLLITQFERLASPAHDSENYKTLESWFLDPNALPIKKRMSVLKLGIQDASPEPKWVKVIEAGILGNDFGADRTKWIQMISDMRNYEQRKDVLKVMLKEFSRIESTAQPEALALLAQEPDLPSKQIKEIALKFLQSKNQKEFEAALKSVPSLFKEQAFTAGEVQKIKDKLNLIPLKLNSPYVEQKAKEVLTVLNAH